MENRNTSGSLWRKWDLHIHSNASDGDASPQEIIDEAKSKGISVIALTDHHTAKNIDEIKECGTQEGITVISGIEFRSEYGEKSVHFIGLFPDSHNNVILNSKALHDLILCPLNISETKIIAKGRGSETGLGDDAAFKKGIFLVQVNLKDAATLIHKYGGLVSVHSGSKDNSMDQEIKHKGTGVRNVRELYDSLGTLKEELFKDNYIDICEIRKENDNESFYLEKFSKPSIIASDAHQKKIIGNKYVWIKADPTFEGLRQITYEPTERVKIQNEIPEQKNDYQIIDSFAITHQHFGTQTIPFNQNLNTIIGGRSAGKSILLGCIAKKVGSNRKVKEKNPEYEKYLESILPFIKVNWKDGGTDSSRDVEFFPQSYINSLAADSIEVNKLIENIIKNDQDKKAAIDTYHSFCIDNKSKINQEIANYFALKDKTKEKQLEMSSQGSKEGIEKQIEKFKQELQDIKNSMNTNISEEEEANYWVISENIGRNSTKIVNSKKTIQKLESFKKINIANDISNEIMGVNEDLMNRITESYKAIRSKFVVSWVELLQQFIDKENSVITDSEDQIHTSQTDELFIKCNAYFSQNISYKEREKKLKTEEEKLKIINELEKEVSSLNDKIDGKLSSILALHREYFIKAQNLSDKIKFEKGEVKISAFTKFNQNKFQDSMATRFDQRSSEIRTIIEYKHENNDKYFSFIDNIFKKVTNGQIQLKGSYGQHQVLIDIFAENYYKIEYDVSFEGDSLSSMSEGKKAFIILRILLDFDAKECPILIDQPEDDLDNRAIYDQLVKYIRKKKKERQIILVTHNPNIVVGADAEEVIVSNQHGINSINQDEVRFEYFSGSLENTHIKDCKLPVLIGQGIKQHVCDVLEGGDEAFKKREQKYGMKV